MIYIKNAEIYTPSKIIKNAGILIEGRKVRKVIKGKSATLPVSEIIDCQGRKIIPRPKVSVSRGPRDDFPN